VIIEGIVITMSIQIVAADRVPSFILIFGLSFLRDILSIVEIIVLSLSGCPIVEELAIIAVLWLGVFSL
jgi:hypothetical protein